MWNSWEPALDLEGSDILAIRRVSSAVCGSAGGPVQVGATDDVKGGICTEDLTHFS
jgi:hypothetical protein